MPAYAYHIPANSFVHGRGHRAHRLDVGSETSHPTDFYWGARTDEQLSRSMAERTAHAANTALGWRVDDLHNHLKKVL